MDSYGNFSQIFTQISEAFSSVESKTKSLQLVDVNYISEEECMLKLTQMSNEIPFFQTILKYKDLFTLCPQPQLMLSIIVQSWDRNQTLEEIGVGANAKVFLNYNEIEKMAVKIMQKVHINMLEFYIQECINQYHLVQIDKEYILNFKGLVYISIINTQASIYIPLELAEYSLFDYIQNNEITEEIYQYFYNLLKDMLILLHSNNYAHRDIKPQNILFIKGQGWKLADFGESIKYEQRQDLYKIQGTLAFLPQEIRKQINKNKEIYQDLFKNDLYAVMCTLVMIKNPQFKPKDLINYMDTQNFDQRLQQLDQILKYEQSFDRLTSLKILQQQMNMDVFKTNIKPINLMQFNIKQILILYYRIGSRIDQDFIISIDDKLKSLIQDNKLDQYQQLQLYLILLCPFQVHQLKNFNSKLLNHQQIIQNSRFYLEDKMLNQIYLDTFWHDCEQINNIIHKAIYQKNSILIHNFIRGSIRLGNFQLAKDLLQIFSNILINDINFDSNLFFFYNILYFQIHGKALLFDEKYIKQNCPQIIENIQIQQVLFQTQFNLQQYLNENKFFNMDTVNLIILLEPLFPHLELDQSTLNVVFQHIIQIFQLSEFLIIDDKFILSNVIKSQLIQGGFFKYKQYIYEIIAGIGKLLLNYDLFEGLLDFYHYFLYFIKFMDLQMYFSIILKIQNLIFKLNIPIYHIKEALDVKLSDIKSKQSKSYYLKKIHLGILTELNKFLYNMIQDQQKTEQSQFDLDSQYQIINLLTYVKIQKSIIIFYDQKIYQSIKQYAQLLGYIQSQNQKYLSVLVLACRYLCDDSIDYKQINIRLNREMIKFQLDPILLQYFILCKQVNRINELFINQKTYENLTPIEKSMIKPLAEIVLRSRNNLNRINQSYDFFYLQILARFVENQKFRSFFNFKQHLFAANISKSQQKKFKLHNISLKEQYLRVK